MTEGIALAIVSRKEHAANVWNYTIHLILTWLYLSPFSELRFQETCLTQFFIKKQRIGSLWRNLVLSRAVFDSFSFLFRCFLTFWKGARESNTKQMCSHDQKFRDIDGKVTKICFLMRRETSSLKVITYFDSFACRIWCGSWIRVNVRETTNLPLPSPQNSQPIIGPG